MKPLLTPFIGMMLSCAVLAQKPSNTEKILPYLGLMNDICSRFMEEQSIPGMSLGLMVDGELIYDVNMGYADMQRKTPSRSISVFRIASMSKSFTAMAILRLRDEGKLQLDDPISKYLRDLKTISYPTADAEPITIRHLLTHGAGFPEDNPWGDRQLADSDSDLMQLFERQISFSTTPGTAYEYSNLGFALLGRIITKVSGMPYQVYIREKIWRPLDMVDATWEYGNVSEMRLAKGYRYQDEEWIEEALLHDNPNGSWGAMGGMLCSVEDLAAYMQVHLSAWPPSDLEEKGPIRRSSIREMHHPWRISGLNATSTNAIGKTCPTVTAYGYGLRWSKDCEGRVTIGHSGGLPGFGSNWQVLPDYGIGIVSMANRTYAPMSSLNAKLLDTLIRLSGIKPIPVSVSPILEDRKNQLARLITDWRGAEDSGIFAENFFPDYTIDLLRRESVGIFSKIGGIVKIGEMEAENRLRGRFIVYCEKGKAEVSFTLSPENPPLIQAYSIRELTP